VGPGAPNPHRASPGASTSAHASAAYVQRLPQNRTRISKNTVITHGIHQVEASVVRVIAESFVAASRLLQLILDVELSAATAGDSADVAHFDSVRSQVRLAFVAEAFEASVTEAQCGKLCA
jgi:hypothetical protein